jgi:sugar lactone lactonase YvrE
MRQTTFRAIAATWVLGALAAPPLASATEVTAPDCSPSGQYGFVCGMKNPEDLVRVPGTNWVIASGMAAGGALYLIDSQRKTWTELYPGEAPRADHDAKTYGACPGAPAREGFVTHGLSITPVAEGRSRLYVVGHGAREAIEVFDVDASGSTPVLTWRGCVPTPEAMEANSVAASADGSLLVTIPLHKGIPIGVALAGKPTGGVYRWSPGPAGMTMVAGSELPYANGIEISADGKEFYVASSGLATVLAYSNTDPARLLRQSAPLTFIPDNLHAAPDGRLLTAGLNLADEACGDVKQSEEFSLEEFASCPRPFTVVTVDPQSMQVEVVATGPANPRFSNITMALPVGEELWIGTFAGDRVAYGPLRRGD